MRIFVLDNIVIQGSAIHLVNTCQAPYPTSATTSLISEQRRGSSPPPSSSVVENEPTTATANADGFVGEVPAGALEESVR